MGEHDSQGTTKIVITRESFLGADGRRMAKHEDRREVSSLTFFSAKQANQYLLDNGIEAKVEEMMFDLPVPKESV